MRFNKSKCKVLHLEKNNCMHHYSLGDGLLERSSAEKDLSILFNNRLTVKANDKLGYIRKSVASW